MSIKDIHLSSKKKLVLLAKSKHVMPSTLMANSLEQLLKLKLSKMASLSNLRIHCKDNHILITGSHKYFMGLECLITVEVSHIKIQAMPAIKSIITKYDKGFNKQMPKLVCKDLEHLCKMHNVKLYMENDEKSQIQLGSNKLFPKLYLRSYLSNDSALKDFNYILNIIIILIQLTNKISKSKKSYFIA